MQETFAKFRRLDPEKIVETVEELHARIEQRFTDSGLGKVVGELLLVARESVTRGAWIQRPHLALRVAAGILSVGIVALFVGLLVHIRQFKMDDFTNSVQAVDASISSVVFIGAAILFLVTWENRIKRKRALDAVHELRALAHIIDMHQLTKDPQDYLSQQQESRPAGKRLMTSPELNRYLDFCSDALGLISKIAALYVQDFQDPVLLDAVDDVEDLTSGFSRKIWQKITLLETLRRSAVEQSALSPSAGQSL